MPAFGEIVDRELPVLVGDVESLEEALLLLVTRDVEEDLDDPGAVPVEVALEGVDVLEPVLPDLVRGRFPNAPPPGEEVGVDPCDQDLLVVRPVEDPNHPPGG